MPEHQMAHGKHSPASSQISSRLVDSPERIALLGNMHLHSDGLSSARGEVSVKAAKT